MNKGSRRIFYDKITGEKIHVIGRNGDVVLPTLEQDIATFTALSERNRETFDVIELEFGEYAQEFAECSGYRVNPTTKTLEFSYPDPNQPEMEPVFERPLTERLAEQEQQIAELNLQDITMMEMLIERGLV